ncbi:nucleoporin p58/p45 isoform X2 [Festucalex cinctus]
MSGLNFGTGTFGSTAAGGGFSYGVATSAPAASTGGFSFGNALGAATTTSTTTPSLGLGGSVFGQKPQGGFSLITPASGAAAAPTGGLTLGAPASTAASTGFSMAFNKPTGSAGPFSLTAAATSSSAPTGTGLTFGSVLTSTAPQQPQATGFALGLGSTTTTTAAAATVPSLGGGLFSSTAATGLGQTTLGGGGGLTLGSLLSSSTAATATSAPSIGLGGVDFSTSSKNSDNSFGARGSKRVEDENLPPVICQDVENFQKFVKEQKQVQEDISRMSSKAIARVQDDIKTLKQNLSVSASSLQRHALFIDKLKVETAQELQNAELAIYTQKTPPELQLENTAPSDYFRGLLEQFQAQLQQYPQQIQELENHLNTLSNPSYITPQDLTMAMQKLYETFVGQAAQLQSVHANVKILKDQYLAYRRAFLEDSTNVFASKRASNSKCQSTARATTGPAPFSSVPNAAAVAMAATLTQQQQPTPGFGAGPGFGGVGTGGSSFAFAATTKPTGGSLSAGFGGTNTSGFNFSNPGINPSAGLTFGVSNPPTAGFGTGAPLLQLKKPPAGNKRGKR